MAHSAEERRRAKLMRGALQTPREEFIRAPPFEPSVAPKTYLVRPSQLSDWGNVEYPNEPGYGDCVTAEEAFAKACHNPEIYISRDDVIAWARQHGVLNGAYLPNVMQQMTNDGFRADGRVYDDGPHHTVDWSNAGTLQSAIAQGPVKLGVVAAQLDTVWHASGGEDGWFATGFHAGGAPDHCTSLCGYGTLTWLAHQFNALVPAGVNGDVIGYAMFTWDSIGIIDHASMMAITHEAWIRQPTTIIR